MKTIAYIDGYNLYYSLLRGSPYKWLDVVVAGGADVTLGIGGFDDEKKQHRREGRGDGFELFQGDFGLTHLISFAGGEWLESSLGAGV